METGAHRSLHPQEVRMASTRLQRRPGSSGLFPSLSREMDQLQANIRRMFDNPLAADAFATMPQPIGWMPPVEVREWANEVTLTAELAGMDAADVHVQLDGDVLTLRGEKKGERKEGEEGSEYYLVERSYGAFQRSFGLPSSVDPEQIRADFDKGVLTIRMPKTAHARTRGREIPVTGKK
jgi:HSP20 family protein